MKHHLLKKVWQVEENALKCTYCGAKIDELESHHHLHMHYKGTTCRVCKKKIWAKVPFHGSGHDNFMKSELEEKVK